MLEYTKDSQNDDGRMNQSGECLGFQGSDKQVRLLTKCDIHSNTDLCQSEAVLQVMLLARSCLFFLDLCRSCYFVYAALTAESLHHIVCIIFNGP